MKTLDAISRALARALFLVAGVALVGSMLLTAADVALRLFRRPILGTYEMIGLLGAVVIAFSLPQTSRMKGHVFMDFITDYLGATGKAVFHVITRMAGIALFAIISWNFYKFALDSYKLGEVTPTLQLPIYPVLFAIAVCCATQCLALFVDMLQPPESPQDSQS